MILLKYLIIFILKIIENSLATLRLILVSNGKKWLGAFLLFTTSIIWIVSSHIAIIDINISMVLIFSVGSLLGSYIGSILEEKMAIGNNMLICITQKQMSEILRQNGYIITKVEGYGKDSKKEDLFVILKRNQNKDLISLIRSLDQEVIIVSEHTNILYAK